MRKIFVSIALILSIFALSQVKTHTVQPQETVYGISNQYGITQEQLIRANPFLNQRTLQIGDVLQIPGQNDSVLPQHDVNDYEDEAFYYRVIKPKQTLYSLAKEYDVSQEIIKNLNPFIEEKGLQINDIVRIPKKIQSQEETEEIVVPDGMHLVKAGETVFSIAKQYNLEMADIYAANRNLQTEGLKKGSLLQIPSKKMVSMPVSEENHFEHKVIKDDTVFSILRKYDVSLEELISENPELQNGLQLGMTLKIPMKKGAKLESEPKLVQTSNDNFKDNEINIVWMMPFFLDTPNSNKGERQVAQDFYMGGQLALDRLIKSGKNINVKIVDVQGNTDNINQFLDSPEVNQTDAIIGPFFHDLVLHVAQKLEKTQIPVFSPVVNAASLEQFNNVYFATPRDEFAADIIIEEMAKAYNGKQEVKILTTSKDENIANYLQSEFKKRFGNAKITITKNPNDLKLVEHRTQTTLEDGANTQQTESITYEPILAVLATENNQIGSQFVDIITRQNPDHIDGFSIYFVPALDVFDNSNVKNINALKEIGFTYTASRLVNTFGATEKEILADFNEKYCMIPTKFMSLGYDVVYDVIDRMDKSGKISDFDAKRSETRLSSKFSYDKVSDGKAKINKELRIIRLNK
ncbi:MAG: LysM peptidoglycan-binding domain-containing protein [Flavobacteriaceae bacterium]|nr:LysM peptidoglycan-binding domain-containing protein [Flavobacteriaceae bacterium]